MKFVWFMEVKLVKNWLIKYIIKIQNTTKTCKVKKNKYCDRKKAQTSEPQNKRLKKFNTWEMKNEAILKVD